VKQFPIPVYLATSPEMILGLASWVWMRSFTRSMGAVQVLATAPETPPARKLIMKSDIIYTWEGKENLLCGAEADRRDTNKRKKRKNNDQGVIRTAQPDS